MSGHVSVGELIDLSSPVSWNAKPKVFTPLIPLPVNQNVITLSPVDSNPFDIVAAQTNILPNLDDPFELVYSAASTDLFSSAKICNSKLSSESKQSTDSNAIQNTNRMDSVLNEACIFSTISSIQNTTINSQDSDLNDSVFTQDEINFNEVAKEANKIARQLSESANTFSQSGFPSGIEDDIMSCEPSWVCDSSDDEADSLRKDPALNLRINYSGMSQSFMEIKKSLEESDAVKRFKSLKRRSLGMQADNDDLTDEIQTDEKSLRRSASVGSQLQEYNHPPTSVTVVAKKLPIAFVKPEENISSKLKPKKPLMPVERKPLKALIPLQNMARNYLQNKEKVGYGLREISPTQKSHLIQPRKHCTPVKRIPSGSPKPVASSTPALSSRKRHSFSSKQESTHKSRSQFSHFGSAARRSSSASSGIPTPISLR